MDGRSFLPLAQKPMLWREALLYEYYWERNFTQTPTLHAVRGERYKYVRYQGIWDTDELYDLQADPGETKNLIRDPAHQTTVRTMNRQLWTLLGETNGMQIPLLPDRGLNQNNRRRPDGANAAAPFPPCLMTPPGPAAPPKRNTP